MFINQRFNEKKRKIKLIMREANQMIKCRLEIYVSVTSKAYCANHHIECDLLISFSYVEILCRPKVYYKYF